MRILLIPVGSAGDVHPYVSVGLALQRRGHDVRVITSPYFASLLDRVGLPLIPLGTVDDFRTLFNDPLLWNPFHGINVIGQALARSTTELYQLIKNETAQAQTVLIAPGMAFAARIAHETLGVPLVTMHLQPTCFISQYETPVLHPWLATINHWPATFKRQILRATGWVSDRALSPGANTLRQTLGLPPVRHIVRDWWHSPARVIGLFPDWYAPPQPDWPRNTTLTGFPLYDEQGVSTIEPDLKKFLSESTEPPIVFTPGSANTQAANFFTSAVDACRQLNHRGLLLTRFPDQIPDSLPIGIHHSTYAPLSEILPNAAALVHHGGIGTAAQALRAACPQLIMPMTFDQPDNADRLYRLRVGRLLSPSSFTGPRVAKELEILLGSENVSQACHTLAQRFVDCDPIGDTCSVIESMD